MNQAEYRDLCRDVSLALGAEHLEVLFEIGRIDVDGVEAALFFSNETSPETLFCYVDLGEIPREHRADVCENLLQLNLITGSKSNAVFAIDPASGRAVLVAHLPVSRQPDAATVVKKLRLYARQANSMRGTLLAGPTPDMHFPATQPQHPPLAGLA